MSIPQYTFFFYLLGNLFDLLRDFPKIAFPLYDVTEDTRSAEIDWVNDNLTERIKDLILEGARGCPIFVKKKSCF